MSDEIKVKKDNVIRALARAEGDMWHVLSELFPDILEEESKSASELFDCPFKSSYIKPKESELEKILHSYWMHVATNQGNYQRRTEELKQQIIDTAKRKVEEMNYNDFSIYSVKQKLEEM